MEVEYTIGPELPDEDKEQFAINSMAYVIRAATGISLLAATVIAANQLRKAMKKARKNQHNIKGE